MSPRTTVRVNRQVPRSTSTAGLVLWAMVGGIVNNSSLGGRSNGKKNYIKENMTTMTMLCIKKKNHKQGSLQRLHSACCIEMLHVPTCDIFKEENVLIEWGISLG